MTRWNASRYDLARLLTTLLGRSVRVALADPQPFPEDRDGFCATYVDDEGILEATCHLELSLAAAAGCALSLLSPNLVEDAVTARDIAPPLFENILEICNVLAVAKNGPGLPHVTLDTLVRTPRDLSKELRTVLHTMPVASTLRVHIENYGDGLLGLRARSGGESQER